MQISELKSRLAAGRADGWYLFCGEEAYLRRHYLNALRAACLPDRALAPLNHLVLEGEKVDLPALGEAVKAPPVMAERKLVEWHLCDLTALREGEAERLLALREEGRAYPETTVCFVLDPDCFDPGQLPRRPSRLYTALSAGFDIVCFDRSNEAALAAWLARHFQHEGVAAAPPVLQAILGQSGRGMDALCGEVEKLVAYVKAHGRAEVTEADVAAVCARVCEIDAFDLSDAILHGEADRAYACLQDMRGRRVEPAVAVGAVARVYSDLLAVATMVEDGEKPPAIAAALKMHEYKVKLYLRALQDRRIEDLRAALSLCRRADLAAKGGSGADGYLALELLLARAL